jgi:hypothetical protein
MTALVVAMSLSHSLAARVSVPPRPSFITTGDKLTQHPITIRYSRLEAPATQEDPESTILKFEVQNESDTGQTDIEVSVSLLGPIDEGTETRPVLVRPFIIRIDTVLHAGYSLEYEIRLRNVQPNCDCLPSIDILNARAVVDETN